MKLIKIVEKEIQQQLNGLIINNWKYEKLSKPTVRRIHPFALSTDYPIFSISSFDNSVSRKNKKFLGDTLCW